MIAAKPSNGDNPLEALRFRMAESAAYFHPFDAGSVPFRIAADMNCSNYTDEQTGTAYIRLANGKPDAASTQATEGYSVRLPDNVEAAANGCLVSVNVVARAAGGAQSRFALAYSTNEVGNSGWRWQEAGSEWSVFTMEYFVPVMIKGNGDFVGILPEADGGSGTEFCYLSVDIAGHTKSVEFPYDLFDHSWYADAHQDLNLPRDLPRETRFIRSTQHYLQYGGRQRRWPNPLFDPKWYAKKLSLPPDVDPLVHYAQHERYGGVSPNPWWERVSSNHNSINPPPCLSSLINHYPIVRKPTYIIGLFGTGRWYLNSLILNSGLEIAYCFLDGINHYYGTVPLILSGHVTSIYETALCGAPAFGRELLSRAAAGLINLIFLYRHPLDSLLTNWAWFRDYLGTGKMTSGIDGAYKAEEKFHRDLNDNIYEFSLFCGGSKDFARIVKGPDANWAFLSLVEFINETEIVVSSPNVHCFRLEDFKSNAAREFKRLLSIVAPDLAPKLDGVPSPRSLSSRYQSAKQNVNSFRSLIGSLPAHIARRLEAMGYSV